MKNTISRYIESKKNSWSETTKKSESARLRVLVGFMHLSPELLYEQLKKNKPYTIKTTWTRLVNFYDWMIENEGASSPNPYKRWKKQNSKVFRHVYQRKTPEISFAQAKILVEAISDQTIRNKAKLLLLSGLRYAECNSITGNVVIGKGGKHREIYNSLPPGSPIFKGPYWKFWEALKVVGLKPHTLRKCFATHLVNSGLNGFDLCEIMGWESLETAKCYVAPKQKEELRKRINEITQTS